MKRIGTTKRGMTIWFCKCECGNLTRVTSGDLTSGNTKSCGCYKSEKIRKRNMLQKGKANGKANPHWKGDDAGSDAVHVWLKKNKPKPDFCERCKRKPPRELSYNHANGGWTRNPDDYEWLCRNCHLFKDRGKGTIMTKGKIWEIREFYTTGAYKQREIAEMFGVHRAVISRIVNYKRSYFE